MKHYSSSSSTPTRTDWRVIRSMVPYLMEFKTRLVAVIVLLVLAKLTNVAVPLVLKSIVDAMGKPKAMLAIPVFLVVGYGLLRLFSTLFGELRDALFAKVTQRAIRRVALQVFEHLHSLSLRFHLERQTGGVSRDIERGTRGISFLLTFLLFNILPTLLEIGLVAGVLFYKYNPWFAIITFATLVIYIAFTLTITEWRMVFRRTMNDMDSKANTRAIDSLINYETVKYFGNERFEVERYDEQMQRWEVSAVRNQTSLATLNAGQSIIIAVGVTLLMLLAADGVVNGTMTIGDLVLVNVYMLQLYMPLHFLGFVYREIKNALADMEKMFRLLDVNREVQDAPHALPLKLDGASVRFDSVNFSYDPAREILHEVSFDYPVRAHVGRGGSERGGQIHVIAPAVPFLRCERGRHLDRWTGYPQCDAGQSARGHRHRPARHGALQRHHLLQHRLRPAACNARGSDRRGAVGPHPHLHRILAAGVRLHGGRARPEAFRWREAACGHRARDFEESGNSDL